MEFQQLKNKKVLITGASRGIGKATAKMFAKAGATVGLVSRSKIDLNFIHSEILSENGNAMVLLCDTGNYKEVSRAVNRFLSKNSKIDILIGNAATIEPIGFIENLDALEFSRSIDVNLKGIFYGMKAVLPCFIEQGHGTIINVSSGAANYPIEGWAAYCSGKAGAAMLTQSIHKELHEKGITAISLSPGTVATDMQEKIRSSKINDISKMQTSEHLDPSIPARALCWLSTSKGWAFSGKEVSLKDPKIFKMMGLKQ